MTTARLAAITSCPRSVSDSNGPRSRIVVAEPDGTVGELAPPFTSLKPFLAPTSRGVAVGAGHDEREWRVIAVRRLRGSVACASS